MNVFLCRPRPLSIGLRACFYCFYGGGVQGAPYNRVTIDMLSMLEFDKGKMDHTPQGCGRQLQPPALSIKQTFFILVKLLQELHVSLTSFLSWKTYSTMAEELKAELDGRISC